MNMSTVIVIFAQRNNTTPHLCLMGYVYDASLQELIRLNKHTVQPPRRLGWGVTLLEQMFMKNNVPLKTVISEMKVSLNEPSDLARIVKEETTRLAIEEFIYGELPIFLHVAGETSAPIRIG